MISSTTVMGQWPNMTYLFLWILLGNLDLIISVSMMYQRTRNISTSMYNHTKNFWFWNKISFQSVGIPPWNQAWEVKPCWTAPPNVSTMRWSSPTVMLSNSMRRTRTVIWPRFFFSFCFEFLLIRITVADVPGGPWRGSIVSVGDDSRGGDWEPQDVLPGRSELLWQGVQQALWWRSAERTGINSEN